MTTAVFHLKLSALMPNCCLLAGLLLVGLDSLPSREVLLPLRILTLSDYLLATGLIPYFSFHLAKILCQSRNISIKSFH